MKHDPPCDGTCVRGRQVFGAGCVGINNRQSFVDETGLEFPRDGKPNGTLGDESRIGTASKRELLQNVGSHEPPLVPADLVPEGGFNAVGIEDVAGKRAAGDAPILIFAERGNPAETVALANREVFPVELESLQGFGNAGIIGIDAQKQFAASFPNAVVEGRRLTLIFLMEVADRKFRVPLPALNQEASVVGGPIVNDQPFEVWERLRAKAFVQPRQSTGTIIGSGENGEPVRVGHQSSSTWREDGARAWRRTAVRSGDSAVKNIRSGSFVD